MDRRYNCPYVLPGARCVDPNCSYCRPWRDAPVAKAPCPACFWFTMLVIATGLLVLIFGCAPDALYAAPDPAPAGLTYPFAQYDAAFNSKLSVELRTAPPEIQQVISDYIKLRCAIKPQMAICKDLRL